MNKQIAKHLYWELKNKIDDIRPVLYSEAYEKPIYVSDSLIDNYGIDETDDINLIFEEVVNDFKMTDKDKPYLLKLLTDFSIEKFLKDEYDYDFLLFLRCYNFSIRVCFE